MSNRPTSDQQIANTFDQLAELAETTGAHAYLASVHASITTRHLETVMKTQEDLTAEIEKARQVVNDRIAQDQARITQDEATIDTLTKAVEDLKAHPAAPDLQPQIDSLEALIASIQPPAPIDSTTTTTTPTVGAGLTMSLGQ